MMRFVEPSGNDVYGIYMKNMFGNNQCFFELHYIDKDIFFDEQHPDKMLVSYSIEKLVRTPENIVQYELDIKRRITEYENIKTRIANTFYLKVWDCNRFDLNVDWFRIKESLLTLAQIPLMEPKEENNKMIQNILNMTVNFIQRRNAS